MGSAIFSWSGIVHQALRKYFEIDGNIFSISIETHFVLQKGNIEFSCEPVRMRVELYITFDVLQYYEL